MSFGSWFKDLFFEKENIEVKAEGETVKEEKEVQNIDYDYNLKIFDLIKKNDVEKITSYIIEDKAIALVKMNKFTGNKDDLKEVLNEIKRSCDTCNSRIIGITNNMYFVTKNSINIEKDNTNSMEI